ncbi:hypothetical protein ABT381_13185 [Streptomyces sp. NPDC000151]|uniref:hypothetical protein n=1 Tax=Streptomyces sp. NPDC000151 TaxID=3154244 RepID=UPI00331FFA5A
MSDGIVWLAEEWLRPDSPVLFVTFARGITPPDLAVRLGADARAILEPMTAAETRAMTYNDRVSARVARLGECAGWSFAVEQGWPSKAWWARPEVSAGGVEVLHLTAKPDDPPRECWYYRDGATVGRFDFGERPEGGLEFLVPALEEAGAVDDPFLPDFPEDYDETPPTLTALENHFHLSLPRELILTGSLPAAVTAKVPPENLGD